MKEEEIRPKDLYEEFLKLSRAESVALASYGDLVEAKCPGCGQVENKSAFEKDGFNYKRCSQCGSLYMSPRPTPEAYEQFYRDSAASTFFAEEFIPAVLEQRRELIFMPRVTKISDISKTVSGDVKCIVEVGAGHGIFLEEWKKRHPKDQVCAIEPNNVMADLCRSKGIDVLEELAENAEEWHGAADVVTCFEVYEHVSDTVEFLESISALLKPGGCLIMTSLTCDGFDISILQDKANSVCPPQHINLCSREGFKTSAEAAGLIDIEILTPGKLDVELVLSAVKEGRATLRPFEAALLDQSAEGLAGLQDYLVENKLSSHLWLVARKP